MKSLDLWKFKLSFIPVFIVYMLKTMIIFACKTEVAILALLL